jgi:TatD DNase family protein
MLVDTHCHLTADAFDADRAAVLERARDAGVGGVIVIASDVEDALGARAVVTDSQSGGVRLFTTAGIHPHQAGEAGPEDEARLSELLRSPEVVAVGECGLDFHYDFAPREVQFRWFERQLRLAGDLDLPVVVHCREAEEEMVPRVKEAGDAGVRGVLHCFPGDLRLLETALEAGWSVSFTGIVTFRNFQGAEAVRTVPAGRYFLETDGPYLAPVPHRGKRNEPGYLPLIRDRMAELRSEPPAKVEADSTAAARAFFRLPAF